MIFWNSSKKVARKKNKENTKHWIKKSEKNDEAKEKPINDIEHQSIPQKYGTYIIKKKQPINLWMENWLIHRMS